MTSTDLNQKVPKDVSIASIFEISAFTQIEIARTSCDAYDRCCVKNSSATFVTFVTGVSADDEYLSRRHSRPILRRLIGPCSTFSDIFVEERAVEELVERCNCVLVAEAVSIQTFSKDVIGLEF